MNRARKDLKSSLTHFIDLRDTSSERDLLYPRSHRLWVEELNLKPDPGCLALCWVPPCSVLGSVPDRGLSWIAQFGDPPLRLSRPSLASLAPGIDYAHSLQQMEDRLVSPWKPKSLSSHVILWGKPLTWGHGDMGRLSASSSRPILIVKEKPA